MIIFLTKPSREVFVIVDLNFLVVMGEGGEGAGEPGGH